MQTAVRIKEKYNREVEVLLNKLLFTSGSHTQGMALILSYEMRAKKRGFLPAVKPTGLLEANSS